ncbi:hypothetical protein GCM10028818_55250 [Spirosoma horti]
MCNNAPRDSSPYAKLMMAEEKFLQLTPDCSAENVSQQLAEFKELLWDVIEGSPDPFPFTNSWNMINLYAKADLLDFESGNTDALPKIQNKVQEAITNLP